MIIFTNQFNKANETKKIHSCISKRLKKTSTEFPDAHYLYYDVRATGDFGNCSRCDGSCHWCYRDGERYYQWYGDRFRRKLQVKGAGWKDTRLLLHWLSDTRAGCQAGDDGDTAGGCTVAERGGGNGLYHPAQGRPDWCRFNGKRQRISQAKREQPDESPAGSCSWHDHYGRW